MRVRTDDEVYRVDAVWLGPPRATFPFRARYVAWGVGLLVFLVTLAIERQLGFGFGVFTIGWCVVITIALTRLVCSRISHERPLGAVLTMCIRELAAPRERAKGVGGAASAGRLKVQSERPRPRSARRAQRANPPPAPSLTGVAAVPDTDTHLPLTALAQPGGATRGSTVPGSTAQHGSAAQHREESGVRTAARR